MSNPNYSHYNYGQPGHGSPYGEQPSSSAPPSHNSYGAVNYGNQQHAGGNASPVYTAPPQADDPNAQLLGEEKYYYENDRTPQHGYQDLCFYVLFMIQFIGVLIFAIASIVNAISISDFSYRFDYDINFGTCATLFGLVFPSVLFSIAFLYIIRLVRGYAIKLSMALYAIAMIAGGIAMAVAVNSPYALIGYAVAVLFVGIYFCCVRRYIAFSEEILQASTECISENKTIFGYGLLLVLVEAVYVALTFTGLILSVFYFVDSAQQEIPDGYYYLVTFVSFCIAWTAQTFSYAFYTIICGTVGSWWYTPHVSNPVRGAFIRSFTTSFGSIALAGFILVTIRFLKAIARGMYSNSFKGDDCNPFVVCLFLAIYCIASCIEAAFRYISAMALVQVSLYGKSFNESAKATFSLISQTGIDSLITYDLSGFVMFVGILGCSASSSFLVYACIRIFEQDPFSSSSSSYYMAILIYSFVCGLFFSAFILSSLGAANNTVFVLWAEDPAVMEANRPEKYHLLSNARKEMEG